MDPRLTSSVLGTLGTAFQGFSTLVDGTIQKAAEEFNPETVEAEVETGREIELAEETYKNVYKDDLDKSVGQLAGPKMTAVELLKELVEGYQERKPDKFQSLRNRAQRLIMNQPSDPKWPQLHAMETCVVVIDDMAKSSLIPFRVIFPLSTDKKHLASLRFGERVCHLVDSTSHGLAFEVPHHFFAEVPANRYADVKGKLILPWNNGQWRNGIREFDFDVGLGCLRLIAGTLMTEYLTKSDLQLSKQVSSREIVCDGKQWSPKTWHEALETIYPPSGFKIDPTKQPKLIISDGKGTHEEIIQNVTADEIVVKTKVSCRGTNMGSVKFKVEFWIVQDQKVDHKRTETVSLNWKDAKLLEPKEGERISKVTFVDNNGVSKEFKTPNQKHAVVKMTSEESGKWKVWAETPDELKKRFAALPKAMQAEREKPQFLLTEENLERIIAKNRTSAQLGLKPSSPAAEDKK